MDNQKKTNEEMPQAQSMQKANGKHMVLIYCGLACWLIGLILSANDLSLIFTLAGLILNCIGLYKTFKYRKLTKPSGFSRKQGK